MRASRLSAVAACALATAIALSGCAPEPIPDTVFIYPPITGEWTGPEVIWRLPWPVEMDKVDSLTVLVNKRRPLAIKNYQPANLVMPQGIPNTNGTPLRQEAATALERMAADAKLAGNNLILTSGYRSYDTQVNVYGGYVRDFGQAVADGTSAKPGHSEHQLGLAADIAAEGQPCLIQACFETTPAGQWLAANSWKYGFILRYPKDMEAVVGYDFEPWHFRFIGEDLAKVFHDQGYKSYEQFLGMDNAPDYG